MPVKEPPECNALVQAALAEDIGAGDATTRSLVPEAAQARAQVVARESAVVCGVAVAREVFCQLDAKVQVDVLVPDGDRVSAGAAVMTIQGAARALLTGERVALNFLQRLSGIASLTARYVAAVQPHPIAILDTRKTTPLLRSLEKYAVQCGGGVNHRDGLYDRVMIKDNHIACWSAASAQGIAAAIAMARQQYPKLQIEVEVDRVEQLDEVLPAKPDWVLLDNMTPQQVRVCVERCRTICRVEVSGGITLATIAAYADSGADAISVGALTHSVQAIDVGLDWGIV